MKFDQAYNVMENGGRIRRTTWYVNQQCIGTWIKMEKLNKTIMEWVAK